MPITPTYPGVYVEEIPSGVRTITGVATSITAFLGRTLWGPDNDPTTINSFSDFERQFGGLARDLPMTYAVRDFFANGGGQAIIVRALGTTGPAPPATTATPTAVTAKLVLDDNKTTIQANSPGAWGNLVYLTKDLVPAAQAKDFAKRLGLPNPDSVPSVDLKFYNLTVTQYLSDYDHSNGKPYRVETFLNVSNDTSAGSRYVGKVLADGSNLIEVGPPVATAPVVPPAGPVVPPAGPVVPPAGPVAPPAGPVAPPAPPAATGANANDPKPLTGGVDSGALQAIDFTGDTPPTADAKVGLKALDKADLFNLLCIPNDTRDSNMLPSVFSAAMTYCQTRRALLVVDPPVEWGENPDTAAQKAVDGFNQPPPSPAPTTEDTTKITLTGEAARNAALFFPRINLPDPLNQNQIETFAPCGAMAGIFARTDAARGVWKAPAGLDATLNGNAALQVVLSDEDNGRLNPLGINCLRTFPIYGTVVWGARTARGADQVADEYKYIPVRRLALYIEESLFRGTKWVVFEPNDEPLWAQVRLNVGAFMNNLFRQGAFQGKSARDAYFVKCDGETTTQNDIDLGIVNIVVGFAPLKPAEFVFIKLQQIAGQVQV